VWSLGVSPLFSSLFDCPLLSLSSFFPSPKLLVPVHLLLAEFLDFFASPPFPTTSPEQEALAAEGRARKEAFALETRDYIRRCAELKEEAWQWQRLCEALEARLTVARKGSAEARVRSGEEGWEAGAREHALGWINLLAAQVVVTTSQLQM
jgi:hypothetical protein